MNKTRQQTIDTMRECVCGQPWRPAGGLYGTTEETQCQACTLRALLAKATSQLRALLAKATSQRDDLKLANTETPETESERDHDNIQKTLRRISDGALALLIGRGRYEMPKTGSEILSPLWAYRDAEIGLSLWMNGASSIEIERAIGCAAGKLFRAREEALARMRL